MRAFIVGLTAALLATGCAYHPPAPEGARADAPDNLTCNDKIQPEEQVQLDRVDTLMARDHNHAALAQLEARPLSTVGHWVRYGQLKASTGRLDEAETIFSGLVEQCGSGRGHHGLGMVLLKKDEVMAALDQLRQARELKPASAQVRNDYGYVLLMVGEYGAAAYELRTAMELGDGQGPVRQNLAVAYLLTENWAGLQWMTQEYDFDAKERAYAERLAATFRSVQ
ncbi:tetratricopeptide repeat protein [Alloalcanivorax sp. C16-2]|uniref:tetratricopeptide repeat protein n=1 Tax=Alloalcanivorax sp. C16-2 TaxID=3390052 RepID=UPI0039705483